MAIEHILGLVAFIVVILTLSLLLPTKSRRGYQTDSGSDGGGAGSTGWFSDGGDSGGGDGGGGD
jgi:hypothetical protein